MPKAVGVLHSTPHHAKGCGCTAFYSTPCQRLWVYCILLHTMPKAVGVLHSTPHHAKGCGCTAFYSTPCQRLWVYCILLTPCQRLWVYWILPHTMPKAVGVLDSTPHHAKGCGCTGFYSTPCQRLWVYWILPHTMPKAVGVLDSTPHHAKGCGCTGFYPTPCQRLWVYWILPHTMPKAVGVLDSTPHHAKGCGCTAFYPTPCQRLWVYCPFKSITSSGVSKNSLYTYRASNLAGTLSFDDVLSREPCSVIYHHLGRCSGCAIFVCSSNDVGVCHYLPQDLLHYTKDIRNW